MYFYIKSNNRLSYRKKKKKKKGKYAKLVIGEETLEMSKKNLQKMKSLKTH